MASQTAELKMPQTGNAQREPSMEEILASIRRIIEESDQARKPETDSSLAAPRVETPRATNDVEAFRDELREEDTLQDAPSAVVSDFASRLTEAHGLSEAPSDVHPVVGEEAAAEEAEEDETAYGFHQAEPVSETFAEPEPDGITDEGPTDMQEDGDEPVPPSAANSDSYSTAAPEQPAEKPSIISEHTGRQVAAAFGELSQAFMASRQRSFDDMAAEMMRPMLQDWLDNNLPTIVEKLVREEIERVARGV